MFNSCIFPNYFIFPCGRLSWLPVSFLLHVKYTLSYLWSTFFRCTIVTTSLFFINVIFLYCFLSHASNILLRILCQYLCFTCKQHAARYTVFNSDSLVWLICFFPGSFPSSSSFLACNSGLRSAIRLNHPPQRAVLSQICCFWERKVVFQILLDGAEPNDAGTT